MPGPLPDGEPVPSDGSLPESALGAVGRRGFGVYVHVPFCASRCGYCDFNTYTASELGGGTSREGYADAVLAELKLAATVTGAPVDTVFVGGGTPTLLDPDDLGRILEGIDKTWGLTANAEVTTEANPESVTPRSLQALRKAGFTRISLGMQSAAPAVLAILDRKHTAGRAPQAAIEAREAGFDHVNLDLIYGTPGERPEDFDASLRTVIDAGVDHVSAYSLIVEDGTRMAARMRRGELPYPEDDVAADRYLAAEQALSGAGFSWYEVSNWATTPDARCRHNMLYWTGGDWWGLGPGAHSHVGGVRWWNVKHPSAYAKRVEEGVSPGLEREILTDEDRHVEDVMLRVRLRDGLPLATLDATGLTGAAKALADGLLDPAAYESGQVVLTLRGRLLADAVIRDLLP
ncbi:radical SAM family heme chaperone HemW [Actinoplanes friuliensis]|jgi:putative oxygen-independent coproporphyrinogen III oxidase|uniref:Heme chaperone HemW n=1 Tax=Actinoplanes friuliensis DSM 7358 TaxID=1246995 RepID=U5VVV7_9ACTN|nr:radical SAM family heme chaperone HemW [Actinoplanes friuliensis]AGZ39855.1 oxygen-independent coproporphyrinogen III oxidase [Actinoplanes friuliensis DSM 7358]